MKKTRRQNNKKTPKISQISNTCFLTDGFRLCDIDRKCGGVRSCVTVFGIVAAHIILSRTHPLIPSWATPSLTDVLFIYLDQRCKDSTFLKGISPQVLVCDLCHFLFGFLHLCRSTAGGTPTSSVCKRKKSKKKNDTNP